MFIGSNVLLFLNLRIFLLSILLCIQYVNKQRHISITNTVTITDDTGKSDIDSMSLSIQHNGYIPMHCSELDPILSVSSLALQFGVLKQYPRLFNNVS